MSTRHRFPTKEEIHARATEVSRIAWKGTPVRTKLFPRGMDMAAHVGEGVFMTRCPICGAVFLDPGASTRPASLTDHLFQHHDVYDGYYKPIFPLE